MLERSKKMVETANDDTMLKKLADDLDYALAALNSAQPTQFERWARERWVPLLFKISKHVQSQYDDAKEHFSTLVGAEKKQYLSILRGRARDTPVRRDDGCRKRRSMPTAITGHIIDFKLRSPFGPQSSLHLGEAQIKFENNCTLRQKRRANWTITT